MSLIDLIKDNIPQIVEFVDKSKKRFFMNKRKNNETLDSLSMHKALKEVFE